MSVDMETMPGAVLAALGEATALLRQDIAAGVREVVEHRFARGAKVALRRNPDRSYQQGVQNIFDTAHIPWDLVETARVDDDADGPHVQGCCCTECADHDSQCQCGECDGESLDCVDDCLCDDCVRYNRTHPDGCRCSRCGDEPPHVDACLCTGCFTHPDDCACGIC